MKKTLLLATFMAFAFTTAVDARITVWKKGDGTFGVSIWGSGMDSRSLDDLCCFEKRRDARIAGKKRKKELEAEAASHEETTPLPNEGPSVAGTGVKTNGGTMGTSQ